MSENKNMDGNKQELIQTADHGNLPEDAAHEGPKKESPAGLGMMSGMAIGLVFGMMLGHMSLKAAVLGMVIGMLIGASAGALTGAVKKKKQ